MLVATGCQVVLARGLLAGQLLRQVDGGATAPDLTVVVACGGRVGPSGQ